MHHYTEKSSGTDLLLVWFNELEEQALISLSIDSEILPPEIIIYMIIYNWWQQLKENLDRKANYRPMYRINIPES